MLDSEVSDIDVSGVDVSDSEVSDTHVSDRGWSWTGLGHCILSWTVVSGVSATTSRTLKGGIFDATWPLTYRNKDATRNKGHRY